MPIAYSKLTRQGQISVPSSVRKQLGIGPGSIIEWDTEHGRIVVQKAHRVSSLEMHRALFPQKPRAHALEELKAGIKRHVRSKHGRPRKERSR